VRGYPNYDTACINEYVRCREDGDITRADKIWVANPDLHQKFVEAMNEALAYKAAEKRDADETIKRGSYRVE
jgi:ABC-type nitrate/sulfonate/bicarbonate transport system substrate-binding protein